MKKLLSIIAIATCGIVLFASCQSSEAVTRNLLEYQGYRYNITNAQQCVDPVDSDTLFVIEDGDTLCAGFTYCLALNSPGIGADTLAPNDGDLFYTYPTDGRKWAQLVVVLKSPGLNGLCEGTYTIRTADYSKGVVIDEDDFFTCDWAGIIYDKPVGAATKAVTSDDLDAMYHNSDVRSFREGTITIKQGMAAYDIEINAKDYRGYLIVGRYTGFVPFWPKSIWDLEAYYWDYLK